MPYKKRYVKYPSALVYDGDGWVVYNEDGADDLAFVQTESLADTLIEAMERASSGDEIALVWTIGDVQSECTALTDDQAREVLQHVLMRHDASLGVHWQTLRSAAADLFGTDNLDDEEEETDEST